MHSNTHGSPLRVGLVGLGRVGLYHLTQISLRSDLKVVAACDDFKPRSERVQGLPGGEPAQQLIQRDDLDWILVTTPLTTRATIALAALDAGKCVAVEAPMCRDRDEASALLDAAQRAACRLCVLPTRRDGLDFRSAQCAVRTGLLGTVCSARLVSWARAVRSDREGATADEDAFAGPFGGDDRAAIDDAFVAFAWQYVDQQIQLVGRAPRSVFARFGPMKPSQSGPSAFLIAIAFHGGGDGLIDVDLASSASLHTGWALSGDVGCYHRRKVFSAEASGEVGETPIILGDDRGFDVYSELVGATNGEHGMRSAGDAETVARVIEAARESARSGRTISLSK